MTASGVLLCSGLGVPASAWSPVVALLDDRTLTVDRVAVESDYLKQPLRLETEVERMRVLMAHRPMTLAGHSFGGLFVEALARRHPELARGLVLLDSSVELGPLSPGERVLHRVARLVPSQLPKPRRLVSLAWELEAYLPIAVELQQWRARWPLPDVPIEILTAVSNRDVALEWVAQQRELADLLAADPPGRQSSVRQVNVQGSHLLMSSAPGEVAASIERVTALAQRRTDTD